MANLVPGELERVLVPVSPETATRLRDQTGESDLVEAVNRAWVGETTPK